MKENIWDCHLSANSGPPLLSFSRQITALVVTVMVILLLLAVPRRNLMLPLLGELLVVARRVEVVALAVFLALRVSVHLGIINSGE